MQHTIERNMVHTQAQNNNQIKERVQGVLGSGIMFLLNIKLIKVQKRIGATFATNDGLLELSWS